MRGSYLDLWNTAKVLGNWSNETKQAVDAIVANRSRYEEVQNKTGVPWYIVAVLHSLESSRDFGSWLANGDPLTAPTVHVPAGLGRGMSFPVSFVKGCEISLAHAGVRGSTHWDDLTVLLETLEAYNGMGYVPRRINSPYLWSGTQHYAKGKYVADGVWDSNAVSAQLGCATLLKEIQNRGLLNMADVTPVATWFDFQRDASRTTVITAYAGPTPVAQVKTNIKKEIVSFLNKFPQAGSVLVGLQSKPIPVVAAAPIAAPIAAPVLSSVNSKMVEFYKVKSNYDRVFDDVMQWYGTTSNGCVAFMSTALRMTGYSVPMGEISLVTTPFSDFLISKRWKRISLDQLLPGDVCFSIETDYPGYPSHTYCFLSWANISTKTAWIIDNQGFTHERNMLANGPKDAFQYALRAV